MHFKLPFFSLNLDLDGADWIFWVFLFGVMGPLILTYIAMIVGIVFWSLFFLYHWLPIYFLGFSPFSG